MKLFTIICESMIMDDLQGQSFEGFKLVPFNTAPARFSAEALWCLNTGLPKPPIQKDIWNGDSCFKNIPDPLMGRYSTRIISNFWPNKYDPTIWDPESAKKMSRDAVGIDPDNHQWATLTKYLSGDLKHDWLVYWPTVGHLSYRLGDENKGIPENIRNTTAYWLEMVQKDILPKVPEDVTILIHTDHGCARLNKNLYDGGFAFIPQEIGISFLEWTSMRNLVENILWKLPSP